MLEKSIPYLLILSTMGFVLSCGEEAPQGPPPDAQFRLEVTAFDRDKEPIARVPVMVDGNVVGYTDKDGIFQAVVTETPGTELTLSAGELEGFRWLNESTEVTEPLRLNSAGIGIPMALNIEGESRKKEYLVWVRVECDDSLDDENCKGLPVKLNGEEVAVTDDFGHAHFSLTEVPQEKLAITIDTPDANPLTDEIVVHPEDPTFEAVLGLESQVFLLEQEFTNARVEEKPKKKRRYRKKRRTPRKKRPAVQKKEKKKDSGSEVIDLW